MNRVRSIIKFLVCFLFISSLLLFALMLFLYVYTKSNINFKSDEALFLSAGRYESTSLYANSGEGQEYIPKKIESTGVLKKNYIKLEAIPEKLRLGFIAVEDRKFYTHSGVDLKRTVYAGLNYLFKREKLFGASTITQQVIKNISGDNDVKITRKLSEIIRAKHIEKCFEKDEILEVYLNIVPMSEEIYGVYEAARCYFNKEPISLSDSEIATIIGITNAPSAYNPYKNPDKCKQKRDFVLSVMHSEGVISNEEYKNALSQELQVTPRENRKDRFDSWFTEAVIDSVCSDLSREKDISLNAARMLLSSGGYSIYTTMDLRIQNILENYFENTENFPEEIKEGLDYAMTVMDSSGGNILGIVGRVGKKEGNRLLSHATTPHVPASTLKPIALYAPLIDEGQINWATILDDVPLEFINDGEDSRPYPKNSPNVYDGILTVKDCLRLSKNTAAVRLCKLRGVKCVFYFLKNKFGFETLVKQEIKDGRKYTDLAIAPLALGQLTNGISLQKLTEAYTVFPSDGKLTKARNYLYVKDHNGNTVLTKTEKHEDIFKPETARIMNKLLSNVVENGTAKKITLKNFIDTAGKTGTSGGDKDRLFIGYTPYYTAGIWCGYDSGRSIGSVSKSHLSIWDEVMTLIHQSVIDEGNLKSFSVEGILYRPFCMDSGKLYSDNCMYDPRGDRMEYGYFIKGTEPTELCNTHVLVDYDTIEKGIATKKCPTENITKVSLVKILRSFPEEIVVVDAEFVYRDISEYSKNNNGETPYFYGSLLDGEYAGVSETKKQFNRYCQKHR